MRGVGIRYRFVKYLPIKPARTPAKIDETAQLKAVLPPSENDAGPQVCRSQPLQKDLREGPDFHAQNTGIRDRARWIYRKHPVIVYNHISLNFDACIIADDAEKRKIEIKIAFPL